MKFLLVLFISSLICCATDPYKVCYDDKDISADPKATSYCIEQVRRQQMAAWQMMNQQYQQNQYQQQQMQQQNMQLFQRNKPTQTNCTTFGNQTNCQSY